MEKVHSSGIKMRSQTILNLRTTGKIPKQILKKQGETTRKYKQRKRAEIRSAIKRFDEFSRGSVFFPGGYGEAERSINIIAEHLDKLKHEVSIENWGR
jgi:hypothetical protein